MVVAHLRNHMGSGQFAGFVTRAHGHGAHARAPRRLDAERRIFEDDAMLRRDAQAPGGLQEDRGLRLAG